MAICSCCKREFSVSTARRVIGARFGAGTYNQYYPDGDVCEDCAWEEISADYATGEEIKELMGSSWYDD